MTDRILISACLLGRPVRYDGRGKLVRHPLIDHWQREGRLVPLCPEVAAGFPTPRPPAEIEAGAGGESVLAGEARVREAGGRDVTFQFLTGARIALQIARDEGCRYAVLTDGSPSCGATFIYDGNFGGVTAPGHGVVTALLEAEGIEVFSEAGIDRLAQKIDQLA